MTRQRPGDGRASDLGHLSVRVDANVFSMDDASDVGLDEGTNVSSAYRQQGSRFTGRIEKVLVEVK